MDELNDTCLAQKIELIKTLNQVCAYRMHKDRKELNKVAIEKLIEVIKTIK